MKGYIPIALSSLLSLVATTVNANTQIDYIDQQKLHDINKAVSAANIKKDIKKLVSFGTRPYAVRNKVGHSGYWRG